MSKAIKLSVIMCIMFLGIKVSAQTISLNTFPDLSTIDFTAFSFEKELTNQPRIMQIVIIPTGVNVYIVGSINWKKNESTGFQNVGTFTTENFLSRSFFNDEIGSTDIKIKTSSYNPELTKDLLKIGKPSGVISMTFNLFDSNGNPLGSVPYEMIFLNPTPPEIISPISGSIFDVGSIPVMWTKSSGASSYRILANYIADNQTNYEQALNAGNPVVNNRDVGDIQSINLSDVLDREIISDTNIVLVVKAIVQRPGGEDELKSAPVIFSTGTSGSSDMNDQQISGPLHSILVLLSNVLGNQQVNQTFLNNLISGKYSLDQIQFTDEYGNVLSIPDFQNILNYLEANKDAIICVQLISQ